MLQRLCNVVLYAQAVDELVNVTSGNQTLPEVRLTVSYLHLVYTLHMFFQCVYTLFEMGSEIYEIITYVYVIVT